MTALLTPTWTDHLKTIATAAAYTHPAACTAAPTSDLMRVLVYCVDAGLECSVIRRELERRAATPITAAVKAAAEVGSVHVTEASWTGSGEVHEQRPGLPFSAGTAVRP